MVLRGTSTVVGKKYGTIREEEEEGARSNLSTKHGTLDDEVKRELGSGSWLRNSPQIGTDSTGFKMTPSLATCRGEFLDGLVLRRNPPGPRSETFGG